MIEIILAAGIPSAITGFLVWYLKRKIDEQDRIIEEREQSIEKMMVLLIGSSRATNVLAEATAKAVQRIPDAHCNGDMTAALATAEEYQRKEKVFILEHGVKDIFGE